jgi:hypothetical protein
MSTITTLEDFYLNSLPQDVMVDTVQITYLIAPGISKQFNLVRNAPAGFTGYSTTSTSSTAITYIFVPFALTRTNTAADLQQSISLTFGYMGDYLNSIFQQIADLKLQGTMPTLVYRSYAMTPTEIGTTDPATPLYISGTLYINNITMTKEGLAFEAQPYSVNTTGTGYLYLTNIFTGLQAFL